MKIEFENSIKRLSFFSCLPDIKIVCINPWWGQQSISAHVSIPTSKIALDTSVPLTTVSV